MRQLLLGLSGARTTGTLFGEEVVLAFEDPAAEARALREGAGLLPAPWERLCWFSGGDRRSFLQAMLTQDIEGLEPSRCSPAALADRKGHLVADLWVLDLEDSLCVRTRSDRLDPFLGLLDRHRIAEKVEWRTEALTCLLLSGPRATRAIEAFGARYVEGESEGGHLPEGGGFWMRVRETGASDFLLAVPPDSAAAVGERLRASVPEVRPVGWEAFNLRRIEAGSAWFALDGDEARLVPEMLPEDRIRYDKGCYLGQETIARLHYVGQLNWRIGRIRLPAGTIPGPGTDLFDSAGERVGWTASAAPDPEGGAVGLAYLHRKFRDHPGPLRLPTGEAVTWFEARLPEIP